MTTSVTEQSFLKDVREHRMTVLHDSGIYRHLRFQKPGTVIGQFDIVTWPGEGLAERQRCPERSGIGRKLQAMRVVRRTETGYEATHRGKVSKITDARSPAGNGATYIGGPA